MENFRTDGYITISNWGGFEVMLSNCGSQVKLKDNFGSDKCEISEWLEIEYLSNEDGDIEAVIDPDGYNIKLSEIIALRN